MSEELTFSLIDNPWIIVRYLGGEVKEVSLQTLVDDAKEIESILGEIPSQAAAIFRLVLAIALCSQRMYRADGSCVPLLTDRWLELWESPEKLGSDMAEYLAEFRAEFDLFDSERPFMQVPDLHTSKNELSEVVKIMADVPDGERFFTLRHNDGIKDLSFSEAARWLVHVQACDTSGIKSGAVGDPRVKGGKGYPIGTGWLGQLGFMMIEGENLAQTLLLNMIPADRYDDVRLQVEDLAADLAAWERDGHTALSRGSAPIEEKANNQYEPEVMGPIDLMTWQARRVRLNVEDDRVTGVVLSQGDRVSPQNKQLLEPMSAWRYSKPQTTKFGYDVYMPKEHYLSQLFWQGLPAIVAQLSGTVEGRNKEGVPQFLSAAVIRWMGYLVEKGVIPQSRLLPVHAIGIAYGPQSASYGELIDDRLLLPAVLMEANQREAHNTLDAAFKATDEVVFALSQFAVNLKQASGAHMLADAVQEIREREAEVSYFELDEAFRGWLTTVGGDPTEARKKWRQQLYELVSRRERELVDRAGPRAVKGTENIDLGKSLVFLRGSVYKALNRLYEERKSDE